jgi:endo-1,3-1,4-beta-glycanase ExoK
MICRPTTLIPLCLLAAIPTRVMAMASAELYKSQAYRYGRFEARIQHAPGDGVVSSFFLWKDGSELSGAYWNEIDFEKVGADCRMQTNARYGTSAANHGQYDTMPGQSCAEYHDYRIEWTPDYIAWAVDGSEFRRDTGDTATAFKDNATAGMTIHFNLWPGNASFGGNIDNTTLPVHEYIAWVQYSSYDSGNFTVEWREDFQTASLPAGWATGTWGSAYNLSTHNAGNVAFVEGIAALSLTTDAAAGAPVTPHADDGTTDVPATGGEGGGSPLATGGSSGSSGGCSIAAPSGSTGAALLGAALAVVGLRLRRRRR